MKKIKTLQIITLALAFVFMNSCTDENKFTNPITFGLENGGFVAFVTATPDAAYPDPSGISFSDTVTDPNNNLSSYSVDLIATLSGNEVVVGNFYTTTTFPADISFTSQSLADALGIEVSDINFGDTFNFIATAIRNDGEVFVGLPPNFDGDNLTVSGGNTEPQLQTPAYKSAMNFGFIVSCPFVQEDMIGTYTIVSNTIFPVGGGPGYTFEIIAGPTANQITLINPWNSEGGFEVTLTASEFGLATWDWQYSFTTLEVCCPGYTATQTSNTAQVSLSLSCIGLLDLKYDTRLGVAGGPPTGFTFGEERMIAQKN